MSITFDVCKVDRPDRLLRTLDRSAAIPLLVGAGHRRSGTAGVYGPKGVPHMRLEAMWSSSAPLVAATDSHALAQAAHDAFYRHHPLVLTPDAIWFCIAQGFANHVAANAETLRARFVKHEGKKKLTVVREDFALGQPNPWPEAFTAFSDQIAAHVGKLRDLVVPEFSTTGPLERAASEVLLMDTFQVYFEYEMRAGCGIPLITLEGTVDDWKSVRRRASMLSEFGLEAWTRALLPVLDEVVHTAEGKVDTEFWRSFFRYQSGSGPAELTGWILTLFPYLNLTYRPGAPLEQNQYLEQWERAFREADGRTGWQLGPQGPQGPALGAIPSSIASAPVNFVDVRDGESHPLHFVAGLFGVTQDPGTGALAPEFGWAIVEDVAVEPRMVRT